MSEQTPTPKCDAAISRLDLVGTLPQADLDRYLFAIGAEQSELVLSLRHHLDQTQATWPTPTVCEIRAALDLAGLRLVPVTAQP